MKKLMLLVALLSLATFGWAESNRRIIERAHG